MSDVEHQENKEPIIEDDDISESSSSDSEAEETTPPQVEEPTATTTVEDEDKASCSCPDSDTETPNEPTAPVVVEEEQQPPVVVEEEQPPVAEEETPKAEEPAIVDEVAPRKKGGKQNFGDMVKEKLLNAVHLVKTGTQWHVQKDVFSVNATDVLLWSNVYLSGLLFVYGHVLYTLNHCYQIPLLAILGWAVLIKSSVGIAYHFLKNAFKFEAEILKDAEKFFDKAVEMQKEWFKAAAEKFVKFMTCLQQFLLEVITVKKGYVKSSVFLLFTYGIIRMSYIFSVETILYLIFNFGFIVPKLYLLNQKQVDDVCEKAMKVITAKLHVVCVKIHEKLPEPLKKYIPTAGCSKKTKSE